ncbi:MAG: metallophosphoesterase [Candidatus Rokuibacteriota bacterium]
MDATPFRFVHLTDTHIIAEGPWRPRAGNFEFDTAASLRRVVEAVRHLDPAPAFAVLGGDLASPDLFHRDRALGPKDYEPSYVLLAEILAGLPCPIHVLMGNHDDRVAFNRILRPGTTPEDAPCYYSFDHLGTHFVALDSHEPGQPGGVLDPAQLAWLDEDLGRHRGLHAVVFVHHHPWPVGMEWMDGMSLRNGDDLMARLRRHGRTRWVICGHVHLDHGVQRDGLTMLTTPSTCVQLSKMSPQPKMLPGPPAFRVVDVAGDRLSTRVVHLHGAGPADL